MTTNNGLLIAGAGGHGRVIADAAASQQIWAKIGFLDDNSNRQNVIDGWPVLGKLGDAADFASEYQHLVVALGDSSARIYWLEEYLKKGLLVTTIIHSHAVVSSSVILGVGSVVFAGAIINAGTSVGVGCIVNTGAIIDHDCALGDYVHVAPGACLAGGVRIGQGSWIGIGASVRQSTSIGENVLIGAGAAVVNNFGSNLKIMGVPAKSIAKAE